jgi:peptidoglycan-N-acetylglucosamine deacetylase
MVRAAVSRTVAGTRNSSIGFRINQWRLRIEARRGPGVGAVRAAGGVGERVVALTYDDGPSPANTPDLLAILAAADARATFFVVGTEVERHPKLVALLTAGGHDVGTHSYSHRNPRELDKSGFKVEVERGASVVAAVAGSVTLFRPPFGKRSEDAVDVCAHLGLTRVLWSVDSGDTRDWDAERIVREVVERVEPGDIVLMHDGGPRRQRTLDATREILRELGNRGYRFVTVSELLGSEGVDAPSRWAQVGEQQSMVLRPDP